MKILLVGDTHANVQWLNNTVLPLAEKSKVDLIIQVGDFGFYPSCNMFLMGAVGSSIPLWFLDGNHEHHPSLRTVVSEAADLTTPIHIGGNLHYLPRGTRFELDGVKFAVMGGAHSIDRQYRHVGVSWFDAEHITEEDLERLGTDKVVDVLLVHDTVSGYEIPGITPNRNLPGAWMQELPACEAHREMVRKAMEQVQPGLLVHGHYHRRYSHVLTEPWGEVQVEGLDCDGSWGAFGFLELPDLTVGPAS